MEKSCNADHYFLPPHTEKGRLGIQQGFVAMQSFISMLLLQLQEEQPPLRFITGNKYGYCHDMHKADYTIQGLRFLKAGLENHPEKGPDKRQFSHTWNLLLEASYLARLPVVLFQCFLERHSFTSSFPHWVMAKVSRTVLMKQQLKWKQIGSEQRHPRIVSVPLEPRFVSSVTFNFWSFHFIHKNNISFNSTQVLLPASTCELIQA